ncbi:MAG TPA: hypothetical protein VFN34_00235 [Ornithinibacter sp.]|nr:hypothetical protein [Ornithinibacter sp.]
MRTSTLLRRAAAAAAAVTASLALAVPAATAGDAPKPTRDNTCLHPVTGVNLNELFGVPEQLVTACGGPTVGEHWRPFIAYFGAEASKAVYPQGYVPLYPSPVDDILAKLTITVVVDGGTRQEKSYSFSPTDEDAFRTDLTLHDINPANPDLPGFIVIPRMAPLSLGHHTYEFLWVQSAPHCDGTSTDEDAACLPAGEHPQGLRPFDVSIPEPVAAG